MATRLAWRAIARSFFYTLIAVVVFALLARAAHESPLFTVQQISHVGTAAAAVPSPFVYEFKDAGILHESASSDTSSSPYWWVDSGGKLLVENGVGKTMQGEAIDDMWQTRYERSSSEDTDEGKYPQNLFRILTRSKWDNVRSEISFRIIRDNDTATPNRNESNGVLFMSRYKDGDNLYYAGLRVDGRAVIKKKYDGLYYTLAEDQIFPGTYTQGKSLLPREWITIRMETKTENDTVRITLSQKNASGEWKELASAVDRGQYDETPPITGSFPLGIRTDFMDVEFDDFRAEKL